MPKYFLLNIYKKIMSYVLILLNLFLEHYGLNSLLRK